MSGPNAILRILKSVRRRPKRRIRDRNVMMKIGSERCNDAGFGHAKRGPQAKERESPLKSGKATETDLFLEFPERNAALSMP